MNSSRDINLDTYNLSLVTAKEDVLNPRSSTNWALFAYDGLTNRLKLADSGVGGLSELVHKLHPRRPQYGLCRVSKPGTAQFCTAMIIWVGDEVDNYRRAVCAAHVSAIKRFFKEVHVFLHAHSLDELTEEKICSAADKVFRRERLRLEPRREDKEDVVGTNYKRTIAAAEISRSHRESFWACAEREEEERREEERRRAAEDRRRRERERLQQEMRDTEERERRMREKQRIVQEQRRLQALAEAELRKKEKEKWVHQQGQYEEEMRARFTRSESEEKAAEAAALVSHRKGNPREFFRQLSLSSSPDMKPNPLPRSPNTVRSYMKLHHSLTDAFLSKSASTTPTSPCSPKVVSPFFPSTPTPQSPTLVSPITTETSGFSAPIVSPFQPFSIPLESPVSVSSTQMPHSPPCNKKVVSPNDQFGSQMSSSFLQHSETPNTPAMPVDPSSTPAPPQTRSIPSAPSNTQTPLITLVESLTFYPPPPPPPPASDLETEVKTSASTESKMSPHSQLSSSLSAFSSPDATVYPSEPKSLPITSHLKPSPLHTMPSSSPVIPHPEPSSSSIPAEPEPSSLPTIPQPEPSSSPILAEPEPSTIPTIPQAESTCSPIIPEHEPNSLPTITQSEPNSSPVPQPEPSTLPIIAEPEPSSIPTIPLPQPGFSSVIPGPEPSTIPTIHQPESSCSPVISEHEPVSLPTVSQLEPNSSVIIAAPEPSSLATVPPPELSSLANVPQPEPSSSPIIAKSEPSTTPTVQQHEPNSSPVIPEPQASSLPSISQSKPSSSLITPEPEPSSLCTIPQPEPSSSLIIAETQPSSLATIPQPEPGISPLIPEPKPSSLPTVPLSEPSSSPINPKPDPSSLPTITQPLSTIPLPERFIQTVLEPEQVLPPLVPHPEPVSTPMIPEPAHSFLLMMHQTAQNSFLSIAQPEPMLSHHLVPQAPSRPLPALPAFLPLLQNTEPGRQFGEQVLITSTLEEEEEYEDGETEECVVGQRDDEVIGKKVKTHVEERVAEKREMDNEMVETDDLEKKEESKKGTEETEEQKETSLIEIIENRKGEVEVAETEVLKEGKESKNGTDEVEGGQFLVERAENRYEQRDGEEEELDALKERKLEDEIKVMEAENNEKLKTEEIHKETAKDAQNVEGERDEGWRGGEKEMTERYTSKEVGERQTEEDESETDMDKKNKMLLDMETYRAEERMLGDDNLNEKSRQSKKKKDEHGERESVVENPEVSGTEKGGEREDKSEYGATVRENTEPNDKESQIDMSKTLQAKEEVRLGESNPVDQQKEDDVECMVEQQEREDERHGTSERETERQRILCENVTGMGKFTLTGQHTSEIMSEFSDKDEVEIAVSVEQDKLKQPDAEACVRADITDERNEIQETSVLEEDLSSTSPLHKDHNENLDTQPTPDVTCSLDTSSITFHSASDHDDARENYISAAGCEDCKNRSNTDMRSSPAFETDAEACISESLQASPPGNLANNQVAAQKTPVTFMDQSYIISVYEKHIESSPNASETIPDCESLFTSVERESEANENVSETEEAFEDIIGNEDSESQVEEGKAVEEESDMELDYEPAEWHTAELKTRPTYGTQDGIGQLEEEEETVAVTCMLKGKDFVINADSSQIVTSEQEQARDTGEMEEGKEALSLSANEIRLYEQRRYLETDSGSEGDGVEEATEYAFLPVRNMDSNETDTSTIIDILHRP